MQAQSPHELLPPQVTCEMCKCFVGLGTVDCPKRNLGDCPYWLQKRLRAPRRSNVILTLLILLIVFTLLPFSIPSTDLVLVLAPLGATALIALAVAFIVRMERETTLYNIDHGIFWQQSTGFLSNKLTRLTISQGLQPLALDMQRYPVSSYPTSTTLLRAQQSDNFYDLVFIIKAALLSLMAQNVIGLMVAEVIEVFPNKSPQVKKEYRFVKGPNISKSIGGDLETMLVIGIKNPGPVDPDGVADAFLAGVSVYQLVYGLFDENKTSPIGWLMTLVVRDAAKRGLGDVHRTMIFLKHYIPYESHALSFQQTRDDIEAWMRTYLPDDLNSSFNAASKRAIDARVKQTDADSVG